MNLTHDELIIIHYSYRHNSIFKDVYREVGILEVFVGCLMKYSGFLQNQINVESDPNDLELTNVFEVENGTKMRKSLATFDE